jgi:hypothetical protein
VARISSGFVEEEGGEGDVAAADAAVEESCIRERVERMEA